MITTAVFDTKAYDRGHFNRLQPTGGIKWHFLDFRLTRDTAAAANNLLKNSIALPWGEKRLH
jgi:hypothetical protein